MLKRIVHKAALATFPLWERLGLHVVPAQYFYPVPPREDLPEELFLARSECVGVDWQRAVQRHYLGEVFPRYLSEFDPRPGGGLSLVDGAVLHAMIRHHKPRKIVEVGSGHSTRITAAACERNRQDGHPCEFVAIEPYPAAFLRGPLPGLTRLREEKVQHVPMQEFADCDLLFIDSSHVVRMGGDVTHLQLEVVPRVKPGCVVHFHDILLPAQYWKEWVRDKRYFWTEQYMLQAFLAFNQEFSVIWAARLMQLEAEGELRARFPFYQANDPEQRVSSLWIQRRKQERA